MKWIGRKKGKERKKERKLTSSGVITMFEFMEGRDKIR